MNKRESKWKEDVVNVSSPIVRDLFTAKADTEDQRGYMRALWVKNSEFEISFYAGLHLGILVFYFFPLTNRKIP